ncbi:hypothetical protein [Sulfitobacter dubius]|jgi:3-deoxy-D-manno-octulosonate 8-phosphate phosphatase KdsC-like HAD superfamily phosphatase|uniref:hypothetical protein n=1 Tax=Sulfitobacter dubius TaxID=218673 RepID=UPI0022AF07E3|nr:hypothetical protein [Sulfitobacter dubius]MCZ4368261.1 hypothetical protein [Sulfitobacter dubius]|tara:strand:+ start:1786 stop:1947 length:162 start_codon:yes stop_codon:yes gene_type:complete
MQTVTCAVSDIVNGVAVCKQVELPRPPADMVVKVHPVVATITTTNLGPGALST